MYIGAFGPLVLRVALGIVFIAHGLPKLTAPAATAVYFESLGLRPTAILTPLVAVIETGGGLLLLAGAATVVVAPVLAVEMLFAALKVHAPSGLFVDSAMPAGFGHGYEFSFVVIAALVCLALGGPGAWSIDERRAQHERERAFGRARLRSRVD